MALAAAVAPLIRHMRPAGTGSAGMGVAQQLHKAMVKHGLTEEEAYRNFFLVDSAGGGMI